MLVWERIGCQLHSNAVVASVTKNFKFVTEYWSSPRMRGSTIGEGGDTTISSPERSPKQPLPGMRLHDPLHGRQACPEFIASDQELVKYVSGRGYFRAVPSQNGDKYVTSPPPPPIVELVGCHIGVTLTTYYPTIKQWVFNWLMKPDNLVRLNFAAVYLTSNVTIFYVGWYGV